MKNMPKPNECKIKFKCQPSFEGRDSSSCVYFSESSTVEGECKYMNLRTSECESFVATVNAAIVYRVKVLGKNNG